MYIINNYELVVVMISVFLGNDYQTRSTAFINPYP